MKYNEEITARDDSITLSGRVKTLSLVPMKRDKNPYKEKSKSKDKKHDYSQQRERKRSYD